MKTEATRSINEAVLSALRRIKRAWLRGVITFVVGVGLAFVAPKLVHPIYKSETVLLYRESIRMNNDEEKDPGTRIIGAKLKEMLLARTKLEAIIEQFGLYPKERAKDPLDAIALFRAAIHFGINEGTFSFSYEAEDAQVAQKVTTRLAEGLIDESSALRKERANATKLFLEATKARNEEELKVYEQRYAKFLQMHPEFVALAVNPSAMTPVRQVRDKSGKVDVHLGARDAIEQKKAGLRARLAGGGTVGKTDELRQAEKHLADAEAEYKDVQRRFTDNHPDVVAARTKAQLARGARDRAALLQPTVLSDAERNHLQAELNRLDRLSVVSTKGAGSDAALLQEGDSIIRAETDWATLNRDVQEARERNKILDDRLFKAQIALNVENSSNSAQLLVVDPAYLPIQPTKTSKGRVIGAGIGIAFVVALLGVLIASRLDDRVDSLSDVEMLKLGTMTVAIPLGARARRA